MDCFYINLDQAKERRITLEDNFKRFAPPSWKLHRVTATTAHEVEAYQIPGSLRATEKACYLSHRRVIESQLNRDDPFMVIEDDCLFGPHSCQTIENAINFLEHKTEWCLLFNDIGLTSISDMEQHTRLSRDLSERKGSIVADLQPINFYSAASYVVHPRASRILSDYFRGNLSLSIPIDLCYRMLIRQKQIQGHYIFPFATTISEQSSASQIQSKDDSDIDDVWNMFRSLIWKDSDLQALLPSLEAIVGEVSPHSRALGLLWAKMIDPDYLKARQVRLKAETEQRMGNGGN